MQDAAIGKSEVILASWIQPRSCASASVTCQFRHEACLGANLLVGRERIRDPTSGSYRPAYRRVSGISCRLCRGDDYRASASTFLISLAMYSSRSRAGSELDRPGASSRKWTLQ